jgi:hypothetical protein
MMEGTALLTDRTELLMINSVAGTDLFFCGLHDVTFLRAALIAEKSCSVSVSEQYRSLEVRPGGTLGKSLYQAMKAVFLWESAVADGGDFVLAAECLEGLGAPQMERLLNSSMSSVSVPGSSREYSLGDHAAIRLNKIRNRVRLSFRTVLDLHRFGFDSPPESCDAVVENAGFTYPVTGAQNA